MHIASVLIKLCLLVILTPAFCFSQNPKIEIITAIDTTFSKGFKTIKYYDSTSAKYHIKAVSPIDTNLTERKVALKFKSRKGSKIKTLSLNDSTYCLTRNQTNTYVMQLLFGKSEWQNYINYIPFHCRLINVYGEIKWLKSIKTYSQMNTADHPYDYWISYGISDSNGAAFIQYRDSSENYYIDVIDTNGKYLLKANNTSPFDNIRLSSDGSLIVADTWISNDEYNRDNYYYIGDLVKGKSKYIKSSSHDEKWEIKAEPAGYKNVRLYSNYNKMFIDTLVDYDAIPENLIVYIKK